MSDEVNILAEQKPTTVRLADGKDYRMPPIDMTTLANLEKSMGFGLARIELKLQTETMQTMRALVFGLLVQNHPELTLEQTGRLITLKEIKALSATIAEIMAISS